MNSYLNKIAYKWLMGYHLLVLDTNNLMIFKQKSCAALDSCQKVVQYNFAFVFDA
jgi:hypothetical protein